MQYLEILDLDKNVLSGPLPEDLYDAVSLRVLDFDHNIISGTLSTKIGQLRQLYFFQADFNQLIGTIPTEVASLPNLEFFSILGNGFGGSGIPVDVCELRINIYANCDMCADLGSCCTECIDY